MESPAPSQLFRAWGGVERCSQDETMGLMYRDDAVVHVETFNCGAGSMQPRQRKRLHPVQTLFLLLTVVAVSEGRARRGIREGTAEVPS